MRRIVGVLVVAWSCTLGLAVHMKAQGGLPTAARLRGGASAPLAPPLTIGGGEVILDVTVAGDGTAKKVQPVRATPPFTELLARAVSGWSFDPAKAIVEARHEHVRHSSATFITVPTPGAVA